MTPTRLTLLLRTDAVANAALGLVTLGLTFAPHLLGLPRVALVIAGSLTLANAVDLARTGAAEVPERTAVQRSATVDIAYGVALLGVAVVGLHGQSDTARWVLAAVADVSLVVGATKLVGVRHLRNPTPAVAS